MIDLGLLCQEHKKNYRSSHDEVSRPDHYRTAWNNSSSLFHALSPFFLSFAFSSVARAGRHQTGDHLTAGPPELTSQPLTSLYVMVNNCMPLTNQSLIFFNVKSDRWEIVCLSPGDC